MGWGEISGVETGKKGLGAQRNRSSLEMIKVRNGIRTVVMQEKN